MVFKMLKLIFATCYIFPLVSGAIFHLNALEYERMPALFALDEYEACLSEDGGAYCLVKGDLHAGEDNELMTIIEEYSKVYPKHYNHTYIERGLCITQTCRQFLNQSFTQNPSFEDSLSAVNPLFKNSKNTEDSSFLNSILTSCLNETIYPKYGIESRVSKVYYCDRKEETRYNYLDWFVVVLCVAIVAVNFLGTSYDVVVNRFVDYKDLKVGNKLVTSFSIRRNWEWLVSAEPAEDRIKRLQGLHGIRSFACICIILAHATWILSCGFTHNTHDIERTYEATYYQVLYNGMMMVQVFFVISGFLLVYHFKIQAEKYSITWTMIPKVMFVRWWRLSPALGVVIALTATWLRHAGSGPLWNHFITTTVVKDCRTYWWYHLLYINNYAPEDKFCLIQTWHISADTQMFFVGLTVFIATQHSARWRYFLLGTLLVFGVVSPALHVYVWDLDGVTLLHPEFYRTMYNDTFRYLHVFGHNNLVCFIIGMFAGEIIYHLQEKKIQIGDNKILNFGVYLIMPAVMSLMYCGHVFYADGERASLAVRMLYAAVHRPIMGLLVGVGLLAGVFQCTNPLRPMFEWRGWVVPSRLSYAMYLIHFNLIYIFMGIRNELEHVSFYYFIMCAIAFIGLSFMFAFPLFLLVEAPVNRLLKTLLDLGKSKQGEVIEEKKLENTRF